MRRFLTIAVVLGLLVVIVHDVSIYARAQRNLRSTTYDVTQFAGNGTKDWGREQAAARVAQMAAPRGVEVYQYNNTETTVQVWARSQVQGTWVAGIIANLISGKSFSEAKTAPFVITNYRESRYM